MGLVVPAGNAIRQQHENQARQRHHRHGDHRRHRQRPGKGAVGDRQGIGQIAVRQALHLNLVSGSAARREKGLPPAQHLQARLLPHPVPQGGPDLILLDQNQHDALHGALAAEARIGFPVDQVFLVQNDGRSADAQQAFRRCSPRNRGRSAAPARPFKEITAPGRKTFAFPLEGQHQVSAGSAPSP